MRYLLLSLLVVSFSVSAQTDKQRAAIAERIKSFSNVCVTGEVCNGAGGDEMAAPAMDAMAAAAAVVAVAAVAAVAGTRQFFSQVLRFTSSISHTHWFW